MCCCCCCVFFFKQKTAYEMRISDWSSDVCSSDLSLIDPRPEQHKDTTHFGGQEKRPKGRGDEKEQALWLTVGRSAMSGGVGGAYTPDARSPLPPSLLPPSLPPPSLAPASLPPCAADHVSGSCRKRRTSRSEEHTSELQSLMRISYAVFCLK